MKYSTDLYPEKKKNVENNEFFEQIMERVYSSFVLVIFQQVFLLLIWISYKSKIQH